MIDAVEYHLIDAVRTAERQFEAAKKALSDRILELSPFQKGDVVRAKDTGALYRVNGGSGYLVAGRPSMNLNATRVYASGRRSASSSTILTWLNNYEKYEGEVGL